MKKFQAWFLPSGFSLREEEVHSRSGSGVPDFQHVSLPEPRLRELLATLRGERERALITIPLGRVVDAVDRVAARLLDPGDGLRAAALEGLGPFSGYSPPMAMMVLDGMARGWMKEGLWDLIRSEFPDPGVLDGFRPGPAGDQTRALGFPLTFHLGAGTVPGVATTSLIRCLLVKSAVLLKPGLGDLSLPAVFAEGLREEDPDLARSLAVLYWPGEESGRTEAALKGADLVVAYGSDQTIQWVRQRLPPSIPLRAYRHRMGFVVIGRGALGGRADSPAGRAALPGARGSARSVAQAAARSIAAFDQRGCVSPHVFFVEKGGRVDPEAWARLLAEALRELETTLPSGEVSLEVGVAIQQLRGVGELGEGAGEGAVLHGGGDAPWTVLFVPGGAVEPSCLHRTVRILPVDTVQDAIGMLADWAPYLQTVGVVGLEDRGTGIVERLARLGVSRISTLEGVPWPRPWWHHDGSGPLQDLVRWTDLEGEVSLSSGNAEG